MGEATLQGLLRLIYPNQCPGCTEVVDSDQSLCPRCWAETHFIQGCRCGQCGLDLPDFDEVGEVLCDDCIRNPKPWSAGCAAMMYHGSARKMVLGLKHGDRHDLVVPLSKWMAAALRPILPSRPVFAPIPLHWRRMISRKYNQSALLSRQIARIFDAESSIDGLRRIRHTNTLDGVNRQERAEILTGSMIVNAKRKLTLKARNIVLVDDVMTSGATFVEATRALAAADVASVTVLALARAGKAS
ncbi:MAG: ComF family protein [Planktomarina sp.]